MVAVILSWIVISIVFLSFGDFLIAVYNKLCKQNEQYGLTDTFLLGMCLTLIPLSISSFWLPSNHYVLLVYLLLSIFYWFIKKERFYSYFARAKASSKGLSFYEIIFFVVPVVGFLVVILWQIGVFDSLYYHQQNIRWNEEFAVVPGLGNIEHRFGFNSNYLLLSAIFSFRFLFAEAVYSLHVLVLVYVICWIIKEIIQSGYELKRIALLFVFIGYIFTFAYTFTATSTDAIPNTVSFYLIAMLLLYTERLKKNALFFILVPASLITFKLTIIPLVLLSLYVFVLFVKKRDYKAILFASVVAGLVVVLWLIRNVIITGYLIFPMHEIDLFSVDWKVPKYVPIEERDFILSCALRIFDDIFWIFTLLKVGETSLKDFIAHGVTYFSMIASAVVSPLVVLYCLLKKKYINKIVYLVYFVTVLILLVWYKGGPDPRFIGGTLYAMVFLVVFLLLSTQKEYCSRWAGISVLVLFTGIMSAWPVTRTIRFFEMFDLKNKKEHARPVTNILIKQYPYRELLKSAHMYTDRFETYQLTDSISFYISKSPEIPDGRFVCFESPFPCTVLKADEMSKYQDIGSIEARGNGLQDGFRSK